MDLEAGPIPSPRSCAFGRRTTFPNGVVCVGAVYGVVTDGVAGDVVEAGGVTVVDLLSPKESVLRGLTLGLTLQIQLWLVCVAQLC